MKKPEWFRRESWSPADEVEFFACLERSRGAARKSQYLRIQALHLFESGDRALVRPALMLLDRLLTDYPDPSQLAMAHHQRGKCLVELGETSAALEAFRESMVAQRERNSIQTDAYLSFGELVLALRREDAYGDAIAAADEFGANAVFPVQRFELSSIRALIAAHAGDMASARKHAIAALAAASETKSPFRRHASLGLVRFADPEVFARLRSLAA